MRCTFCKNESDLHETDNPDLRLCSSCREKLGTHIAVYCAGCDTLFWLRKTSSNVMTAARMSDLSPQHIMDNPVIHEIKRCRHCFDAVKDYSVHVGWVQ